MWILVHRSINIILILNFLHISMALTADAQFKPTLWIFINGFLLKVRKHCMMYFLLHPDLNTIWFSSYHLPKQFWVNNPIKKRIAAIL